MSKRIGTLPASSVQLGAHYAAGPVLGLSLPVQTKIAIGRPDDRYEHEADADADRVVSGKSAPLISTLTPGGLGSMGQSQAKEEEEEAQPLQTQPLAPRQTEGTEEGEKPLQPKLVAQRQETLKEEPGTLAQMKRLVQRQAAPEALDGEKETATTAQAKFVQRQAEEIEEEEPLQRTGEGAPPISSTTAATIRNPEAGHRIPPSIRSRIEPLVGASLSEVRVHTDASATRAAKNLGARAFTHRDPG